MKHIDLSESIINTLNESFDLNYPNDQGLIRSKMLEISGGKINNYIEHHPLPEDLSKSAVIGIINYSVSNPKVKTICKIAEYLGLKPEEVFLDYCEHMVMMSKEDKTDAV